MVRRRYLCVFMMNAVSMGMTKLVTSGKAYLSSMGLTHIQVLGFVKRNSPFERRAMANSFMSPILSAVKLANSFFSTRTEKLFEMPERSFTLAQMEILGGITIN
jgi:hypothetical protein